MIFKYSFKKKSICKGNAELDGNSIILGRFEGGDEMRKAILKEESKRKLYKLFLDNSGNYAKVSVIENGALSFVTSACISIYYCIRDGVLYFSDLMIDIENIAADSNQMDIDSIYYYIASGNYPPLEFTFWDNIKKIPGEHDVIIDRAGG